MSTLFEIVSQHELFFVDYAIDPLFTPDDIELIDLKKYELMRDRYEKIGGRGQWMMRCSSSVQVNIDITSESDAEEMAFIADCITPIVSLLFSNSPFVSGLPSGKDNLRYCIWNDTDPPRTGSLLDHGINSSESLLEKVCSFIPTVPAIFIIDKDNNYDSYNGSLGEWLESLEASGQLDRKDILTVLHQIFTHVRFKNVIEVRGMDRPPRGFEMAPVAFWTGILMAQESRDVILDIVGNWTVADRIALEKMAAKIEIYQLGPNGKTIEEWLYTFCDIALKGLKMRSEKFKWENEDRYLSPYLDIIKSNGIITLSTQNDFKKSGLSLRSFLIERKANA
jgi:glutamate--cysteine ligase